MDVPVTTCVVVTLQHVPTGRDFITHVETFVFVGKRSKADVEMVNEYFLEAISNNMAVGDPRKNTEVCDLNATVLGGNYKAELNDVTISQHWETIQ
jgi:hypothetical protein